MNRKSKKTDIIATEMILLLILGISQYWTIITVNIVIIFAIILLFAVTPKHLCIEYIFVAMPFFNMFAYKMGTTSMFYLLLFIYVLKYLSNKKISKSKFLILCVFMILTFPLGDISVWTRLFLRFTFLVFVFKDQRFSEDIEAIVRNTSISTILSSVIGYVLLIAGRSLYTRSYVYIDGGSTTRFAGLVGDSVFYGQFVGLIIALNLVLAYRNNEYKKTAYIFSSILTVFVLLTYSKTALILVAADIIAYILFSIYKNTKRRATVIYAVGFILFIIFMIVGVIYYINTHTDTLLVKAILTRFSAQDLWTGRGEIGAFYAKKLVSSLRYLFMAMPYSEYTMGIQTGTIFITRAHNIYLETACVIGIIPAIVAGIWLINYLVRLYRAKHYETISLLPLIILLASGFSLHGHFEWHFYFLYALAFATIHSDKRGEILYEH